MAASTPEIEKLLRLLDRVPLLDWTVGTAENQAEYVASYQSEDITFHLKINRDHHDQNTCPKPCTLYVQNMLLPCTLGWATQKAKELRDLVVRKGIRALRNLT
jgi:hypothetical protein